MSNLNALVNSTKLYLEESLDVKLNEDNDSELEQDTAQSNDEYNEEEHLFNKRSKFSSNCSQFIDSEAKDSDCSDNDIDDEFDIFDSESS